MCLLFSILTRASPSQFAEPRQGTLQQAPQSGSHEHTLRFLLSCIPSLQVLLSEDTYDAVSLCPFQFLGLCSDYSFCLKALSHPFGKTSFSL